MDKAPLTSKELAVLRADSQNIRAAAERKVLTLDAWEERRETDAAKQHFDLGCWLYYYSRRVYLDSEEGLKNRIDCARRIFLAGLTNPGYGFFTVFDFGERQFDTIFEMGDAEQIIDGLRQLAKADQSGRITQAFANFGWTLTKEAPGTKNMSLAEYTKRVNELEHAECARLNREPNAVFGAEHHDYPEVMMALYYQSGLTPEQAIEIIRDNAEAEGYAEAAAS